VQFDYKPVTAVKEGIDRFVSWYRDYFMVWWLK
jgi:nucleoside-diphosphate-sugar epimerase